MVIYLTPLPKVLCFCTEVCVISLCIPLELARVSSLLDKSLKLHIRASSLGPKLRLGDNQLLKDKVLEGSLECEEEERREPGAREEIGGSLECEEGEKRQL